MPFFNFGRGFLGRVFGAALEVVLFVIGYIVIDMVLTALGYPLPETIEQLGLLALAIYFLGRVFGFIGPAA